jgi:hypothetical protein
MTATSHAAATTAPTGCDHLDDAALVAAFDAAAIAPSAFRHREHVRVGFALLARDGDLARAALAFRAMLRRFAAAIGAEGKYHETLTWAYLVLIADRMHGRSYRSSFELLADHPDLLDHRGGALGRSYDVDALTASPRARAVFVLPERR